ncbi:MAG TPA: IS110 family transposase [Gemmataceae bacterium]|jgi:transposase|nr:IS110 family transposase [Gemmataceae bacterium]
MDTLFTKVAGLDVHLKQIQCAVRLCQESGKLVRQVRSFATMTRDLRALADYLQSLGVTHVAMEATGVLWKPVWNVLEGRFTLLLVNPRHLKKVPGRKTDVSDAEWIAQLLQCGLLRGSFVPARPLRELRDLTRHRAQLAGEHTRVANRIHKVLEDANIKLGAVASDVLGKSGRKMLRALLDGVADPAMLADLALGSLRKKVEQLKLALEGHCTEHHRYMLGRLLSHLGYLEGQRDEFDRRIAERLTVLLPAADFARLDALPGVNRTTIENVIAEIGVDMTIFADAHHLASWCGVCPGNEESAGRRLRSRTRRGNRWLRRALAEAAWAASKAKKSYLQAQFRRLAARRGKKRALIAVGHSLLVIIYTVLQNKVEYRDLGPDYFDRLEPDRLRRHLVRRLERLGFDVTLKATNPHDCAA